MSVGTWFEAVKTDGQYIMHIVTSALYKGGNLRPDVYYSKTPSLGLAKYNQDFDNYQKRLIRSCDDNFSMLRDGDEFDISLHCVLQKNTCGLHPTERLSQLLNRVRQQRNSLCHGAPDVNDDNIVRKLDELLQLYLAVLETLEEREGSYLISAKREITERIENKKRKHNSNVGRNVAIGAGTSNVGRSVAIGAGVGLGAFAIGLLGKKFVDSVNDSQKEEEQKKKGEFIKTSDARKRGLHFNVEINSFDAEELYIEVEVNTISRRQLF